MNEELLKGLWEGVSRLYESTVKLEEQVEKLTAIVQPLGQISVQLADAQLKQANRLDGTDRTLLQIMNAQTQTNKQLDRLVNVVASHERRLERLEGNQPEGVS